jgi:hypothetical protein
VGDEGNISLEEGSMEGTNHSIFRPDAMQRYIQREEKQVLPQFVSPRIFLFLWALLGLLILGLGVSWFTKVPVYASGPAVVMQGSSEILVNGDGLLLIAFLPPKSLSSLRVGQTMLVHLINSTPLKRPVIVVEPEITSPTDVQEKLAFSDGMARADTQPAAVAIAPLEPVPTGLPAASYIGGVFPVDVEVGSRRVISLLPGLRQLLGE